MSSLDQLLTETSVKTLQEYMVIQTVKAKSDALKTSTSASDSQTSLVKKPQNIFRAPLSKEPAQVTPEEICGEETSLKFKHIVGRFFAWTSFGASKEKKEAEEFVDMLHSTWLHGMLPKTSWIGDETKKTIIEKVLMFNFFLFFLYYINNIFILGQCFTKEGCLQYNNARLE
jgi:predicted metalloendopeptidase